MAVGFMVVPQNDYLAYLTTTDVADQATLFSIHPLNSGTKVLPINASNTWLWQIIIIGTESGVLSRSLSLSLSSKQ
jgi:hypothetical protein